VKRAEKLKNKIKQEIESGQKPNASNLAETLSWPEHDVHRCLNSLEKKGEIKTYVKKFRDRKIRFISVKR